MSDRKKVIYERDICVGIDGETLEEYLLPKCPVCGMCPTYNMPECPDCGTELEYEDEQLEDTEVNTVKCDNCGVDIESENNSKIILFGRELTLKQLKQLVLTNQDKDGNINLPTDWIYILIEKAEEGERYKERLQISPYGDDIINELEESLNYADYIIKTYEKRIEKYTQLMIKLRDMFRNAERIGKDIDVPKGERYIKISDTLARKIENDINDLLNMNYI